MDTTKLFHGFFIIQITRSQSRFPNCRFHLLINMQISTNKKAKVKSSRCKACESEGVRRTGGTPQRLSDERNEADGLFAKPSTFALHCAYRPPLMEPELKTVTRFDLPARLDDASLREKGRYGKAPGEGLKRRQYLELPGIHRAPFAAMLQGAM